MGFDSRKKSGNIIGGSKLNVDGQGIYIVKIIKPNIIKILPKYISDGGNPPSQTPTNTSTPPPTPTPTTVCQRPLGLINKAFNWKYTPSGGPEFIFTGSFLDACTASNEFDTNIPSGSMQGKSGQVVSLTVGETVYLGIFSTNCTLLEDGFYITNLTTNEITEVVGGVIASIQYCS